MLSFIIIEIALQYTRVRHGASTFNETRDAHCDRFIFHVLSLE